MTELRPRTVNNPSHTGCGADFAGEHDVALVSAFFSTLSSYVDLDNQRAVRRALAKALHNEKFLRTFSAALVRAASVTWGQQESFVLLCWTCLVVARLRLPDAKKAIARLLECQVWTRLHVCSQFCAPPGPFWDNFLLFWSLPMRLSWAQPPGLGFCLCLARYYR